MMRIHSNRNGRPEYIPVDVRRQVEQFQRRLTAPASAADIYSSWQTLESMLSAPQRVLLLVAWNQYMEHKDPSIITDAVDKLLKEIEGC